jgi:hypothetical protein
LEFYKVLVSIGNGARANGFDSIGRMFGNFAESVGEGLDHTMSSLAEYRTANEQVAADIANSTGAASAKVIAAWDALKAAYEAGQSTIDLRDVFGGSGPPDSGGGAGGAVDQAKEAADEIKKTFDDMKSAISGSIMSSFKALLKGTKSISEALLDILNTIFDKILDVVMTPIFDSIAGSIGGAILGGMFSGLSFAGGGSTWSGPRVGGMDGKGGRLAMVHADETVVDHRAGQSSGGNNVYMTVNTPNAESFRASRKQIARQLQGVR